MGFIDFIRRILGSDYDKKVRNLNSRIYELKNETVRAEKEIEKLKERKVKTPSFDCAPKTSYTEFKVFSPFTLKPVLTMKDLQKARKEREIERIKQLKHQIATNFGTVETLLHQEDVAKAEGLLLDTAAALQEINDEHLYDLYEELKHKINDVKERIRYRLIKQQEEEATRKKEDEEREAEKERLRKQRELEEKREKERKAREYEEGLSSEEKERSGEIKRLTALVTRKKASHQDILQYLQMQHVRMFYHFTDERNLYYIRKFGGLYSWDYSEKHNIKIPNPGGDGSSRRLDKRHSLEDFVRLSFCNDHPMAYRKHKEGATLVLLYIDIEVASFLETLFTDRNAASNSFSCGDKIEDLKKINISATQRNYVRRSQRKIFSLHQAECMVKTFIPIKYIINIKNPEKMHFGKWYT